MSQLREQVEARYRFNIPLIEATVIEAAWNGRFTTLEAQNMLANDTLAIDLLISSGVLTGVPKWSSKYYAMRRMLDEVGAL